MPEEGKVPEKGKARFSKERIAELKDKYDPELVEILLGHVGKVDFAKVFDDAVLETLSGARTSDYDVLALERRRHEAAIIKEEVVIFREMGKLMSSINERYREIVGLPPIKQKDEDYSHGQ